MLLRQWAKRSKPTSVTQSEPVDWSGLVQSLIDDGIVTPKEVAEVVLGALNAPQIGTSLASKPVYQAQYPPRKTLAAVMAWGESQSGQCADCSTRLNLEVDHIVAKIDGGEDKLINHTLRCRRCNSSRRHAKGGLTELTTQAALTYIMLTNRPKTYAHYRELCRSYGLTCSDIRIREGWLLAGWLRKGRDDTSN